MVSKMNNAKPNTPAVARSQSGEVCSPPPDATVLLMVPPGSVVARLRLVLCLDADAILVLLLFVVVLVVLFIKLLFVVFIRRFWGVVVAEPINNPLVSLKLDAEPKHKAFLITVFALQDNKTILLLLCLSSHAHQIVVRVVVPPVL